MAVATGPAAGGKGGLAEGRQRLEVGREGGRGEKSSFDTMWETLILC